MGFPPAREQAKIGLSDPADRGRVFQNVDFPERGTSPGSSTPWAAILALIGFVGLCLLVGAVDAEFAAGSLGTWYLSLAVPPGTPPSWVFASVWATLYVLIGVAAWRVWRRLGASPALRLWGWQLALNALWTPALFGLHSPAAGLIVVLVLWPALIMTIRAFLSAEPVAGMLMFPYAIWAAYATYLAGGVFWLN